MSLISFHKFLISTAILFSLGFALWAFAAYGRDGSLTSLVLAVGSALAGIILAYYLRHLSRFLGGKPDGG